MGRDPSMDIGPACVGRESARRALTASAWTCRKQSLSPETLVLHLIKMMLAGGRDSIAVFRQDEVGLPCLGNCSRCINAGVNPKNLHRLGRR
jgi:hypothetical protein